MITNKTKILTVVGTRPEFIKLSETIKVLDNFFYHILVNTNQNFEYELNKIFFDELQIRKPNYNFEKNSNSPISKISENFKQLENILIKEKPDAFLTLGDTNSALTSYVAKRYKVPIFHLEAGNRCFDQRVPEEINRKIIDHLSDINLVYSDYAKNYLINEGIHPNTIIKTGSPMFEVYKKNKSKIIKSKILKKLNIKKNKYFLISFHREEHLDNVKKMEKFMNLVYNLNKKYDYHIIISTHYKLNDRIKNITNFRQKKIKFLKPFGYFDYCCLQLNAFLVLSDSGTINEESSIMGFKAVNLRETHERPEADDEATVQLTGLDADKIYEFISNIKKLKKHKIVEDYCVENFSTKVAKIVSGFIDKVNKDVWKKYY